MKSVPGEICIVFANSTHTGRAHRTSRSALITWSLLSEPVCLASKHSTASATGLSGPVGRLRGRLREEAYYLWVSWKSHRNAECTDQRGE